MTKLYHHKTDGGAEYLTDTFIAWNHNGKSGKEGTITSETKICIRLDGQPELHTPNDHDRAALIEALKSLAGMLTVMLANGNDNCCVWMDVSHRNSVRAKLENACAALAQAEG